MTREFTGFLEGYRHFHAAVYPQLKEEFQTLARQGQRPKALVISCCDSRVDPNLIFQTKPGELFVIRNVASLVPPFEQGEGFHGVSAAVEFAITALCVPHLIVMGHTMCGGIKALVEDAAASEHTFIGQWMTLGHGAREKAMHHSCCSQAQRVDLTSRYAVLASLENLRTFPWIQEKEAQGLLTLHGLQFDIQTGEVFCYNKQTDHFEPL